MNRTIYRYLSLLAILSILNIHADESCTTVTPKLTIRSQGTNALRRLVNNVGKMNLEDESGYGFFSIMPEYTETFRSHNIAQCLFGQALCGDNALLIQGSDVQDRNEKALLADYFYLPSDFSSIVTVEPRIRNFLVDFNFYIGFDSACGYFNNMYFWLQAPITWTKWDLGFKEQVVVPGSNAHAAGYFTPDALARNDLLANFSQYARGAAPRGGVIPQTADLKGFETNFNTVFQGLDCARMCPGSDSNTRISEIRFALGWNFLMCDYYHIGAGLQVSAPTGNKVRSDLLFAPQNGNDHHWELGAEITAHYSFCHSEDEESFYGFYLDANITHMFKNHQRRCFDVCDKPLSRYMLVEKLGTPVENGLVGSEANQALNPVNPTAPSAQFKGVFAPLANITSLDVDVSVGVNADVVFWFNHTNGPWSFDLGYNFWGRSCEKVRIDCDCPQEFEENTWAFKGGSFVYGYVELTVPNADNLQQNDPVALSSTQSKATTFETSTIDNPQFAYAGQVNRVRLDGIRGVAAGIQTSINPIFIKQEDINFASTKGISNKIFSHVGYTCADVDRCYAPYFGLGFEAEFGQTCSNSCDDDCDNNDNCKDDCNDDCNEPKCHDCVKCALSQWGIWAKFGVSFE
jgi:hypothetical protein